MKNSVVVALTLVNLCLGMSYVTSGGEEKSKSAPGVIQAQSFELVDAKGNVRAQLFLSEDGSGNIRLRDSKGTVRVKLGASAEGGTGLLLMDANAEPVVAAGWYPPGSFYPDGPSIVVGQKQQGQKVIRPE